MLAEQLKVRISSILSSYRCPKKWRSALEFLLSKKQNGVLRGTEILAYGAY
jgi:hypothetical protein